MILFAIFCRYFSSFIRKIQYPYVHQIQLKWISSQIMYFVAICLQFYMRMFNLLKQRIKVDKILCMLEFLFQDVIEKCNLSGDYFNAYLHQNYLEFFSEITDVVRASEYLSDSDFMTFEWSVSDTIVLLSNTCTSIHQVDNLCYSAFFMSNTWYDIAVRLSFCLFHFL